MNAIYKSSRYVGTFLITLFAVLSVVYLVASQIGFQVAASIAVPFVLLPLVGVALLLAPAIHKRISKD